MLSRFKNVPNNGGGGGGLRPNYILCSASLKCTKGVDMGLDAIFAAKRQVQWSSNWLRRPSIGSLWPTQPAVDHSLGSRRLTHLLSSKWIENSTRFRLVGPNIPNMPTNTRLKESVASADTPTSLMAHTIVSADRLVKWRKCEPTRHFMTATSLTAHTSHLTPRALELVVKRRSSTASSLAWHEKGFTVSLFYCHSHCISFLGSDSQQSEYSELDSTHVWSISSA